LSYSKLAHNLADKYNTSFTELKFKALAVEAHVTIQIIQTHILYSSPVLRYKKFYGSGPNHNENQENIVKI
jgi:hypothetical protein